MNVVYGNGGGIKMKKVLAFVLCLVFAFGTFCIGVSAADEKVYAVTMGVHKYSVNNTVTDGSNVASVKFVRHSTGEEGSQNKIFDIQKGETFTLTTTVNDGLENFYAFVAWVDGDGVVLGTDTTLEITVDASVAVFATYTENASRHTVTYSHIGDGSVSVSSDFPMQQGDGCVSVMAGSNATVKFTPAENFSVYFVKLNGEKVNMFTYACERFVRFIKDGNIGDAFSELLNFFKILFGKEGTLVIENVDKDYTFEVGFIAPAF